MPQRYKEWKENITIIWQQIEQSGIENFLEKHNLSKPDQQETENLNRPITTNKIEAVIKKLQRNQRPRTNGFTGEFYQACKELAPTLLNYSKRFEGGLLSL